MATYKVLQDIEAEDTLIGPLTLRQCIYAGIAALGIYLCVICVTKGAPIGVLFFLPIVLFGAFFAFPWSKQQPTEVWALAKVRFFFKPRKRIWNQNGTKQLVTITAPKKVKRSYTSNLTPYEVQNRLKALADTIDSRGWAIKNVELGYYGHGGEAGSDRLFDPSNLPQDVPGYDESAANDIFDTQNNAIAQKFDMLMAQSSGEHRQQLMQQMSEPQALGAPASVLPTAPQAAPADDQTDQAAVTAVAEPAIAPPPAPPKTYWHMRPVEPTVKSTRPDYSGIRTSHAQPGKQTATKAAAKSAAKTTQPTVTTPPNPAILELANNNDLNVATIAREAHARSAEPNDEVVVSLR